ncbi:hypothetical protein MKX03_016108 [Papaver bracteatum]|nr:hypothetical protein MKX03_016108 [Papaver bracteatum]
MASKKTHLFKQSSVEAETPGDYYMNPSKKLMTRTSDWRVVEREDGIETITNRAAFKGVAIFVRFSKNQAIGDCENKDDYLSYIVNTEFQNVKDMKGEIKDGVTRIYYPKIKVEDNKKKDVVGAQAEFSF